MRLNQELTNLTPCLRAGLYLFTMNNEQANTTIKHGLLSTISRMSTMDIKAKLTTMDKQPNGTWKHKDVVLETYLVNELFNRWEHEWVEMYNGETE